jgi:uncharacterized protein
MKAREFDPRRLDVRAFAKAAGALAGQWPVAGFERLGEWLVAADAPAGPVQWSVQGEELPVRGGPAEVWLHLRAHADLLLQCQRCLQPCTHTLALDRRFLFVADEATAADMDADADHEVLVFAKELDLHELLEDELLLDLPLVPRHEVCPQPLAHAADPAEPDPPDHPFAALSGLRARKP